MTFWAAIVAALFVVCIASVLVALFDLAQERRYAEERRERGTWDRAHPKGERP